MGEGDLKNDEIEISKVIIKYIPTYPMYTLRHLPCNMRNLWKMSWMNRETICRDIKLL